MAKTVTVRIEDDIYETFSRHAEEERRSLSKFIEHAVIQYTKRTAFTDDEEMREIAEDEGLIRRIKQGTQDAKKGKGRFVA
ncbi:MAG: ribbon-helix-helix protein, CopG family [Deltaproteobacteria bacterium]|jgi:predicted transcriptional regulator|nr:ribbon-helix-helix protein, CopG family [Deltaproteobacteria bacterium]